MGVAGLLVGIGTHTVINPVTPAPIFTRLTFERGLVRAARFADDGGAVVYSAAWDGGPLRLYLTRPSASRSTLLDLPSANLLSASRSDELAFSIGHSFDGELGLGTLARAPLRGNATTRLFANVREADWIPDGSDLAVIRRVGNRDQLEWPMGKVVYASNGHLSTPRVSADGSRLAFVDHPVYGGDEGEIVVIAANGARNTLAANLRDVRGIAWSRDQDEVWFAAGTDDPQSFATIQSISLSGRRRTILTERADLRLLDIDRVGRVLLSAETRLAHIEALLAGDVTSHDLSLVDASRVRAISAGGRQLLITRTTPPNVVVREANGETTALADGDGFDLSNDGRLVLAATAKSPVRLELIDTRSRDVKELPNPAGLTIVNARLLPDAQNVVLLAGRRAGLWSGYLQNISDGTLTMFTGPGVTLLPTRTMVVSPDGKYVALTNTDGRVRLFPMAGGEPTLIAGLADTEYPLAWTSDASSVFVTRGTSPPWRIERLNLMTGQRTPWKDVPAVSTAGIASSHLVMSSDGALLHSYAQVLSNLYIADGLR